MKRLRIPLLLAGAAAAAALWRWSPAEELATPPRASPARTPAVRQAGDTEPGGWQPMSDSVFAATMADFVIMTVHGGSAWFAFTSAEEGVMSPAELGFIPARALLDTAARFESVAEGGVTRLVAITSARVVDSAVRHMDDACSMGVEVPVRDVTARTVIEGPAFTPGMAEVVAKSVWQAAGGGADSAMALEMVQHFPPPVQGDGAAPPPADPSAKSPSRVHFVSRFILDGTEILVGDVRRSRPYPGEAADDGAHITEQRIFIAERPAAAPGAAFQVVWRSQGDDFGESASTHEVKMLLKLGTRRVPTFVIGGQYGDGGGESYLARVAPGLWRSVAGYYVGC